MGALLLGYAILTNKHNNYKLSVKLRRNNEQTETLSQKCHQQYFFVSQRSYCQ